ncbi:MAG: YdcF family protein, partial [Propionibacteriaceae bacterium]|nr:YdcF family protein [Propionibacteriaceae bacterium]
AAYVPIGIISALVGGLALLWVLCIGLPLAYLGFGFIAYLLYSFVYRIFTRFAKPPAAVVVLGAGLINGQVTPLLAARCKKGLAVWQSQTTATTTPVFVVSGGKGADESRSEASAMAEYCSALIHRLLASRADSDRSDGKATTSKAGWTPTLVEGRASLLVLPRPRQALTSEARSTPVERCQRCQCVDLILRSSDESVDQGSGLGGCEQIIQEDRSTTTRENLANTKVLLAERGISGPIWAVTSNYHAFRAAMLLRQEKIPGHAVGAPIARYYWPAAIIREYAAILYDSLTFTLITLSLTFLPLLGLALATFAR